MRAIGWEASDHYQNTDAVEVYVYCVNTNMLQAGRPEGATP